MRRLPSIGFVAVVLTYGSSVAFLAWGMTTPPLDRVWVLHHELKVGKEKKLKPRDRELLESALQRHPDLGSALLPAGQIGIISAHRDGWIDTPQVTIVRTPRSTAGEIALNVQTPPQSIPFSIELSGHGWQRSVEVEARGPLSLPLPAPPEASELLTLTLKGKGLRADSSSLAIQVTFVGELNAESNDDDDDGDDEGGE
jgi:hypothetical protein